jgi:hypothetical protein
MGCFARIICLIGGIAACGTGYTVYKEGGFLVNKLLDNQTLHVNYTGMQKPIAVLWFVMGALCFILAFRISGKTHEEHICLECEHLEMLTPNESHTCPECSSPMEVLFGFYDRHPEKK